MVRHVHKWVGRMPDGLDVVLVQVDYERCVVSVGVLRPDAGLAPARGAVRDRGFEEGVYLFRTLGGERDMSGCRHGISLGDPEVVEVLTPVADTIVLHVEFLVTERGESSGIEPA